MNDFEKLMNQYLEDAGWTLSELAEKSLIHKIYWNKWFSGTALPTKTQVALIANALWKRLDTQPIDIFLKITMTLEKQQ